jgi:hypothetical protein
MYVYALRRPNSGKPAEWNPGPVGHPAKGDHKGQTLPFVLEMGNSLLVLDCKAPPCLPGIQTWGIIQKSHLDLLQSKLFSCSKRRSRSDCRLRP